jgi:hypothetical protein
MNGDEQQRSGSSSNKTTVRRSSRADAAPRERESNMLEGVGEGKRTVRAHDAYFIAEQRRERGFEEVKRRAVSGGILY